MLWTLQICSVKRPNYRKRTIFHALEAADVLCEAPELWKRSIYSTLWRPQVGWLAGWLGWLVGWVGAALGVLLGGGRFNLS
jgi:hypothetical protein